MRDGVWQDILERAKKHTQNAADALQRQQRMLHDAEHQRTQLGHFRDDYALQASRPGTSVSLARLMHLREFVENLDRALAQLDWQVESARDAVLRAQQLLSERRARSLALETLIAKREKHRVQQADRREQSLMDELIQVRARPGR